MARCYSARLRLWQPPLPLRQEDMRISPSSFKLELRKKPPRPRREAPMPEDSSTGGEHSEASEFGPETPAAEAAAEAAADAADHSASEFASEFAADDAEDTASGGAAGPRGEPAAEWPRLVHSRALERVLKRRGLLSFDIEAIETAIKSEERDLEESERMRTNMRWLEDKWARQVALARPQLSGVAGTWKLLALVWAVSLNLQVTLALSSA